MTTVIIMIVMIRVIRTTLWETKQRQQETRNCKHSRPGLDHLQNDAGSFWKPSRHLQGTGEFLRTVAPNHSDSQLSFSLFTFIAAQSHTARRATVYLASIYQFQKVN